ncbi:MAG: glycoside hydrolase family 172 protein [Acidimicrobiales bacterium]
MSSLLDPSFIDTRFDSRALSFENPTGARGAGGTTHGGRKGAPNRRLEQGERVVLADIDGPGTVRHVWLTIPPSRPEVMRAQTLEVFYDGNDKPSVSVPALDFFLLPHGRPAPVTSALVAVQEGRGFNSYLPMPFAKHLRIEYTNNSDRAITLYYQLDLTLDGGTDESTGYLHATFRRENPTVMRRDFVIASGLRGPGRFVGCSVGVRVLDTGMWYGEGEVKVYRDGDTEHPTICGTGLEDYVGTAWGLGAHAALYGGAPLDVRPPGTSSPTFVGFYRWHLLDPIMFREELTVTIQQIGAMVFAAEDVEARQAYEASHPVAGNGWTQMGSMSIGIVERVDDYCATAFVYTTEPQAVPRVDVVGAIADIGRADFEPVDPMEAFMG